MSLHEIADVCPGVSHDLDLLAVAAEVVEDETGARLALAEDTTSHAHHSVLVMVALGQTLEPAQALCQSESGARRFVRR